MIVKSNWATNLTPQKIAAIRAFYIEDKSEYVISKFANTLRGMNYSLIFEGARIYPVSYIGDIVMFMISTLSELISTPNLSPVKLNWMQGNLPVSSNPKIEIGPDKVLSYALKTLGTSPNGELNEYEQAVRIFASKLESATLDSV